MAAAANVHVHSVDIDPIDDVYLSQLIDELDIKNIELYVDDSQNTDLPHTIEYDLLFVDGDHSYEGAFNDMDNWWDDLAIGGHVILHDCYDMYDIPQAVSDFIVGKNIAMHVSLFNSYNVWENKWGSICHFQKLGV
jgi:predicted O-methyltransferase YrrM